MMHKMKEGYGNEELIIYPTLVFSVNNWALKPNQPEKPPFTYHMLAICVADTPVVFKSPKPSSNAERVPQGTKPEAKPGYKKHSTSSKQSSVSSKEATKCGSSKAPTGSKTGHSKFMHENFRGTEGAVGLTRWFEKLESKFGISNVSEGDRVKFALAHARCALTWWNVLMFIQVSVLLPRETCPNTPSLSSTQFRILKTSQRCWEHLHLHVPDPTPSTEGYKSSALDLIPTSSSKATPILLCPEPELVPIADRGGKLGWRQARRKRNGETIKTTKQQLATNQTNARTNKDVYSRGKVLMLASYPTAESVDNTTLTHALLLVTTVERQDIRPKTTELHLVLQTKVNQEAKEDREVMSLVSDVAKKDITKTSF
ncbi:hypothetical protein Tco_0786519 [Tanacetum coccineum]